MRMSVFSVNFTSSCCLITRTQMIIECMKEIYVVEDHETIRDGVVRYLELSGYNARGLGTVAEERKAIHQSKPDLIIQDVMLPDGDGFEFVKELRAEKSDIPVIFMTARSDEEDRIKGFELGADDYIPKPFSPKELVLRVAALFRRIDKDETSDCLRFCDGGNTLVIDSKEHRLTVNEEEVSLTAAEWKIVTCLAARNGDLVPRSEILVKCFDYSEDSYDRVVDTHIKNIRAKLRPGSWIDTVRGYGYRFHPCAKEMM